MKRCTQCGTYKALGEYAVKSITNGTLSSYCRDCQNIRSRAHYKANKQRYLDRNAAVKAKLKLYVDECKSQPCTDCKQTFPPCAMDFHHEDDKTADVSLLVNYTMKRVREEIAKCILLCSNCHRIRHHVLASGSGGGPSKPA